PTCSPHHAHPADFWRYALADMRTSLADMRLAALASDPLAPGVFLKARKPDPFVERDLADVALHSVLARRRAFSVTGRDLLIFTLRRALFTAAGRVIPPSLKARIRAGPDRSARRVRPLATRRPRGPR